MERIEYRNVVNKDKWPRGEWDNEPDKIQWPDADTGLPCLIVRGPVGALCGYVGVSEGHPFYKKTYHDVEDTLRVHGGLTFSDACAEDAVECEAICHLPSSGEPDYVWWFGFDCAHYGDLNPAYDSAYQTGRNRVYRNIAYVEAEIRTLAKQLAELQFKAGKGEQ